MAARDERASNRNASPGVADIVDAFRAAGFGSVRVLWAREGDREVGERQPFDGIDVWLLVRALDHFGRRPMPVERVRYYRTRKPEPGEGEP